MTTSVYVCIVSILTHPNISLFIGGTMFVTTEGDRVGNYEGIDINSFDICNRDPTIQKLVNKKL